MAPWGCRCSGHTWTTLVPRGKLLPLPRGERGRAGCAARAPLAAVGSDALGGCGRTAMLPRSRKAPGPPLGRCVWGLCAALVGARAAVVIRRGGQPGSCPPACRCAASGPVTLKTIPGVSWWLSAAAGGLCSLAACRPFSQPRCSFLGARTRFRMCLPAAADVCLLSVSRNGKPFRGSFASFLGFTFSSLVLTPGRDGSRCSTDPAPAGCSRSLLLHFSSCCIFYRFPLPLLWTYYF